MVIYNLVKPIRSKIFNYKQVVQNIDVEAFLEDPTIFPCSCVHSPFIDKHHGHIITGDLRIVRNNKLRKLLCKGPKFREKESISWEKVKETVHMGIIDAIKKWTEVESLAKSHFDEWREKVFEKVDCKLTLLKQKVKFVRANKILKDNTVANYLDELQHKYVMTPIEKADSNVAFICKRHYVQVLVKELGLADGHTNTYEPVLNTNMSSIVKQHTTDLHKEFGIVIPDDMQTLADIYWMPKLHKTPIKERFIIASKKCTLKQLSKDITSIFKLAHEQVEKYKNKARRFSGVSTFWVIQNSTPVLETLDKFFE